MDSINIIEYAFIVRTNYTIFNSINILLNENLVGKADLYIEVTQDSMYDTINNLNKTKLFKNIYVDKIINTKNNFLLCLIRKIMNIFVCLSPRFYLMFHFGKTCFCNLPFYKEIYAPFIDFNTHNILACSNNANLNYYEDGFGTYNNIFVYKNNLKYKFADLLFHINDIQNSAKKIYLNNTIIYDNKHNFEVKKIDIDHDNLNVCKKVFSNYNKFYFQAKIVFLGQPLGYDKNSFNNVLNVIKNYKNSIVRPHPGEIIDKYYGLNIDIERSLWEIVCYDCIKNNTILIGVNSTALMTPKTLYNEEPFVVFIYELIKNDLSLASYKSCIEYSDNLKKIYNDKNKIFVPTSISGLKKILDTIVTNN